MDIQSGLRSVLSNVIGSDEHGNGCVCHTDLKLDADSPTSKAGLKSVFKLGLSDMFLYS